MHVPFDMVSQAMSMAENLQHHQPPHSLYVDNDSDDWQSEDTAEDDGVGRDGIMKDVVGREHDKIIFYRRALMKWIGPVTILLMFVATTTSLVQRKKKLYAGSKTILGSYDELETDTVVVLGKNITFDVPVCIQAFPYALRVYVQPEFADEDVAWTTICECVEGYARFNGIEIAPDDDDIADVLLQDIQDGQNQFALGPYIVCVDRETR